VRIYPGTVGVVSATTILGAGAADTAFAIEAMQELYSVLTAQDSSASSLVPEQGGTTDRFDVDVADVAHATVTFDIEGNTVFLLPSVLYDRWVAGWQAALAAVAGKLSPSEFSTIQSPLTTPVGKGIETLQLVLPLIGGTIPTNWGAWLLLGGVVAATGAMFYAVARSRKEKRS
jgi:hypothetical protein